VPSRRHDLIGSHSSTVQNQRSLQNGHSIRGLRTDGDVINNLEPQCIGGPAVGFAVLFCSFDGYLDLAADDRSLHLRIVFDQPVAELLRPEGALHFAAHQLLLRSDFIELMPPLNSCTAGCPVVSAVWSEPSRLQRSSRCTCGIGTVCHQSLRPLLSYRSGIP